MQPVQALNEEYWQDTVLQIYDPEKALDIMKKLKDGVSIGRDPADHITESPNWPSATEFAPQITKVLEADLAHGRILGPFDSPPFKNYIVSPLGAFLKRDGVKARVIHDLSYPASDSVNGLIDPEEFSLSYASIDDAAELCKKFSSPPFLAKLDLKDAYKHVPVRSSDWHMLGFRWPDSHGNQKYYFYKTLNFGLRSAPALFDIFASSLCDFMVYEGASRQMIRYVDDFLTVGADEGECGRNLEIMLTTCERAGFQVQRSKVASPCQVVEFLGIIIDTQRKELRISEERMTEIRSLLDQWLNRKVASKRQVLKIIGKLAFAARVVRSGRAFISRLIHLAKKVKHLHHKVRISTSARADLQWWHSCLSSHNGVAMYEEDWSAANITHCYSDASDYGFGSYYGTSWIAMKYSGHLERLKEFSINWREMHAACKALVTWGPLFAGKHVVFHIDNMAVCGILNKLYTPSAEIMELVRTWCYVVERFRLKICVVYISTHQNVIADALSRGRLEEAKGIPPHINERFWPERIEFFDVYV